MYILNNNYNKNYEALEHLNGQYCTAIVISEGEEEEYKYVYEIEILNIKTNKNIELKDNSNTDKNGNELNKKDEKIVQNKNYKGIKLLLNLKKSDNNNLVLNYGDKIGFYLEYQKPNTARNYMGFDYSNYLKTKKILGTVNVESNNLQVISHNNTNAILNKIYSLKNIMKQKINELLPKETAGLCIGMLIGETSNIEESMQEDFRDSNLSHILAVSGANVSYIIISITYIFNKMCFRKKLSKIISIILLILFMLLTGCTSSVNRACIMAILMLIAELLNRKSDVYNNLALSALILLIINPYSILDIGFQLSYMGTIGIVFLHDKISNIVQIKNKIIKYFFEMIIVTTCANLAIIPIMMFHFNTVSLTFYFSNVLAGPILGAVVIIGFIMFFLSLILNSLAIPIAFILNIMLKFIIKIAELTASLPISKILITTPSIWFIIIWYATIIILYYKEKAKKFYLKNKKNLKIAVICILIIVLTSNLVIKLNKDLKIYFIDVGQGDSCLIVTPTNKKILIDGGGSEFGSFDVGEKTLLPYLLDRKIKKLDYVLISHFDSDHVGGILTLMEKIQIEKIIICKQGEVSENYKKFLKILKSKKIKVQIVKAKDKISIDKDTFFYILHPANELIKDNILNNNSIVTKLYYRNFSILFTGDIEEIAEKELIKKYESSSILRSTVLKVGHHGSKTSSTKELLEKVKPKIALIGVGENNNFGHPNSEVLNRLNSLNCKIYRTDLNGEIVLTIDKNSKVYVNTMF